MCRCLQNGSGEICTDGDDKSPYRIQEIQLLYSRWMILRELFLIAHDEYSQVLIDEEDIIDNQVSL